MLKPRQPGDSPPVFGKPWFWQRSSSTMESTRGLAQVIMEMRDEIQKLEAENRELRGDLGPRSFLPVPRETRTGSAAAAAEENPYLNLRRNASAPVLEGQYNENNIMTVRRYSVSSNLSGLTMREGRTDRTRPSDSRWGRLQEEIQNGNGMFDHSAKGDAGKVTNRHSLQEYVHKNRAKVKTVTFLLPVDDIYTSRPVLTKDQELPSITETDS
ncbi:hypothetical protein Q5P01_010228 [Channa striata]|uniref:Uncharacterized protein n=1 Tax=Channa striata TaxID=64152 RepID=A0AA88MXJ4_CHASR|nr:hypothetical protein Q5P01_010228 [Channa striata]